MDDTGIHRLEAALRAAVAAHRLALRAEIEQRTGDFSFRFLLARLGVAPEALDALAGVRCPSALDPAFRADLSRRLAREAARLVRLVRAASPAYDVNRHVAVRRALLWVEEAPAGAVDPASAEGPPRLSGRALNGRFRRSRARRRPPPAMGTATAVLRP